MIILGIDPGTATTGIGIIEFKKAAQNQLSCLFYGTISTPAGMPASERLKLLNKDLGQTIKKYNPDAAAVESLYFFKNAKTVMAVSQARGVILLALSQKNIPLYEFTPLQAKVAVTGYGRAAKGQVQKMIKNILRLEKNPKPDDAADALAIAICCALNQNFTNNVFKKRLRAAP
ncbi:MAG: crossover junction endodeoxyribonuclease RuvC [Candidatus Pacebacteria bacterium]|nr:crossover junction endodeoxyribonuclease RuvC [Candidatus Paceibacterota bacterium]